MIGNKLSIGRNHRTADSVRMTDLGDCFRVDIRWNDGAWIYMTHDTKEKALAHVHGLGWF
jgi:hypothetical protein